MTWATCDPCQRTSVVHHWALNGKGDPVAFCQPPPRRRPRTATTVEPSPNLGSAEREKIMAATTTLEDRNPPVPGEQEAML